MNEALFVGLDGGATRATAVVTDEDGVVRARTDGAGVLVDPLAPLAGIDMLLDLVDAALARCGTAPPAMAVCCALAGAGREEQRHAVEAALDRTGIAHEVRVVTDAEAALQDAFGAGPGILVIAGTGSIAWGRGPDGRTGRTGGWGALLGDEGSAYRLGLDALRAVCRAHDGRGEGTLLTSCLLAETGLTGPEELVRWTAAADKAALARVAPAVIETAAAGDMVAAGLVDAAAGDLVRHVEVLAAGLGPWEWPVPIALAGGLLAPGRPLRAPVVHAIRSRVTPCSISDAAVDAARGAAALARHG